MEKWIEYAQNLNQIASDSNLFNKKVAAKEVFGSNLFLANREAKSDLASGSDSEPQTQWAAQSAAHQMTSDFLESQVIVPQ